MSIRNKTKGTILSENVVNATSFWQKMKGLLFSKEPASLFLKTRWGIHTFGMQYPLDILVLDSNNYVVKIKEGLKPNKVFVWNPTHSTIIELPEQTIRKSKTTLSDILVLK